MKTDNRHWTSQILGESTKGSLSLACAQAYVRMYSDLNLKMNLYLIRRDDWLDEIDYDEYRGHVIAAPNAETARCIAADQEGPAKMRWIWLTEADMLVEAETIEDATDKLFNMSRTIVDPETGVVSVIWESRSPSIFSTVTLLASDVDSKEGIVLSDYNAG